jgi:hypothetical protein
MKTYIKGFLIINCLILFSCEDEVKQIDTPIKEEFTQKVDPLTINQIFSFENTEFDILFFNLFMDSLSQLEVNDNLFALEVCKRKLQEINYSSEEYNLFLASELAFMDYMIKHANLQKDNLGKANASWAEEYVTNSMDSINIFVNLRDLAQDKFIRSLHHGYVDPEVQDSIDALSKDTLLID